MLETRHGSCHCGQVRFRCTLDLAPEGERSPQLRPGPWYATTLRCTCSYCRKTRIWKAHVPAEAFELLEGAGLGRYRFGSGTIEHCFCRNCGTTTFSRANFEVMGGPFVCVNVACLDDVPFEALDRAPVRLEDRANDDWEAIPAHAGWL